MNLLRLATMPVRVGVAAVDVTLAVGRLAAPDGPVRRPGGLGERVEVLIGEGGLLEQLTAVLTDPRGPLATLASLAELTSVEHPLGRALAPGGSLDRLLAPGGPLDRAVAEDGALERLLAADGPVEQLLAADGPLEQLLGSQGPLDRLLAPGGALDRVTMEGGILEVLLQEEGLAETLLADGGFVEKLTDEGGTLDQLLQLGDTLSHLHESVVGLNDAVVPLSHLVSRLPGGRRSRSIEA
ncbi:hypothetical protein GCM10027047_37840 [Rhodococcus aerolatus]